MTSRPFIVREATENDVESIRVALWEAFQHELPRTRPLALEDPAGFAADTTARTLETIRDPPLSPSKWFVVAPSDKPTTVASAALWERVENANAMPFQPATTSPWGGLAQVEVNNEIMVHYRATVGERPHYILQVMATHPSFQGQGAGSAVLRHLTKIADEEGMLSYVDSSPQSMSVYGKFGWKAVGRVKFPEPSTGAEDEPVYVTTMLREPSGAA
ncbi:acyl-CoA N-acyltransferase [Mycena galopus ATCC 62051]|nr:acyl-CoA N-acyltransferase [Mycena galopus ATCC 62051]